MQSEMNSYQVGIGFKGNRWSLLGVWACCTLTLCSEIFGLHWNCHGSHPCKGEGGHNHNVNNSQRPHPLSLLIWLSTYSESSMKKPSAFQKHCRCYTLVQATVISCLDCFSSSITVLPCFLFVCSQNSSQIIFVFAQNTSFAFQGSQNKS